MSNQSESLSRHEREAGFESLVLEYAPLVSKICYMYAVDNEYFKDLYQEVLINLWQGFASFKGNAKMSSWIYRVTLNTCVSYYRHNKRHMQGVQLDCIAEPMADDDTRSEDVRVLYSLISRLDKLDKAVVLLWLDEKSYDEISEITGLSQSNVGVRLTRIKHKLSVMNQKLS